MAGLFQVDTERIGAASGDILRMSRDIEAQVAAMLSRLTALQDAWKGSAATQFQGVVHQWQGAQRQVQDCLDSIGTVLGAAGSRYAETEAEAVRMFTR